MTKVVHASTVHFAIDNRIFHKQCRSMASAGYDVVLFARHPHSEIRDGVRIVGIGSPQWRLARMTVGVFIMMWQVLREKPHIAHFHDPELIPSGLVWKLAGISVVYDVHEDYGTAISEKSYLGIFRRPVSWAIKGVEALIARIFTVIIAEKCYRERFPHATKVLNYPDQTIDFAPRIPYSAASRRLIFTGGSHPHRGSRIHANVVNLVPDIELYLVGRMKAEFRSEILAIAGNNADRIHIDGDDTLMPFEAIVARYQEGDWLAGLAVFPPLADNVGKELTKFFEYMAAGLPIICSDFPVWRELIESNGCGIVVAPDRPDELRTAVERLRNDPDLARQMSQASLRAAEKYTWQSQANVLSDLYARIAPINE